MRIANRSWSPATIEWTSDGRAQWQQQHGQLRFAQIDVCLDDKGQIPSSDDTSTLVVERA